MKSLYNIEQNYLELAAELEESEGELTPELEERLVVHQEEAENKLTSYQNLIAELEAQAIMADEQMKRIQAFKKSKQVTIDKLKASMLQAVLLFGEEDKKGIKRLEYGTLRLSTRKSTFLDVVNEEVIPDKFLKIDISNLDREQYTSLIDTFPELANKGKKKVAKKEITDAIKGGETIDGAILDTRFSLTIK